MILFLLPLRPRRQRERERERESLIRRRNEHRNATCKGERIFCIIRITLLTDSINVLSMSYCITNTITTIERTAIDTVIDTAIATAIETVFEIALK